jgi:hypothetical protein
MPGTGVALLLRHLGGLEGDLAMEPLQLEKLPLVAFDGLALLEIAPRF